MAADNFELQTAFIDGRVITGNESIFFDLLDGLEKQLQGRNAKKFLNNLLLENKRRYQQYGQATFLLEPDLKEGEGGLRDIQAMQWAAKGLLRCETIDCLAGRKYVSGFDVDALDEAFEFLLKVRTMLHFISARKNDRLFFEQQAEISKALGFKDDGEISGIERFMRVFYTNATAIELVSRAFWSRIQEDVATNTKRFSLSSTSKYKSLGGGIIQNGQKLSLESANSVIEFPGSEVKLFKLSIGEKLDIDYGKLHLVRDGIKNAGAVEWTDEIRRDFISILASGEAAIPALETMGYIGILNRYIPEWNRIHCLPQYDTYHLYTVDAHSFLTVAHLKRIAAGEHDKINTIFKETYEAVHNKDILMLAALLHDIGKGFGKGHSTRGAQMAVGIAERMKLPEKEAKLLNFLIENHLLLPDTAMRRDLGDENIIVEIAEQVVTLEKLRMLYLMSIADALATGPKAWDAWKDSLLKELYLKVFHIIKSGEYTSKKSIEHHKQTTAEVKDALIDQYTEEDIDAYLKQMPPSYLFSQSSNDIIKHFESLQTCCDKSISLTANRKDSITEIVLISKDEPGLFCKVSGVLALNGLNILGAQVFTRNDGLVLDIFKVEGYFNDDLTHEKLSRIKNDIKRALEGKIALDYRIADKAKRYKQSTALKRNTRVEIDNTKSDFYTVVEVHAQDRVGLLYLSLIHISEPTRPY
jgi:[protein-PII] uridylyltransferase